MKIINVSQLLTFSLSILLISCGGMTKKVGHIKADMRSAIMKDDRFSEADLVGLDPVQFKAKMDGPPIYEGFIKNRFFYGSWIEKAFVQVYNHIPGQMHITWSSSDKSRCMVVPFLNKNDFKFKSISKGRTIKLNHKGKGHHSQGETFNCNYAWYRHIGAKEISAEELMKKFNN